MKNAGTTDDMASSVEWFFLWVYWCGSTVTSVLYQGYNQPFEALRDHEGGGHHLLVIQ